MRIVRLSRSIGRKGSKKISSFSLPAYSCRLPRLTLDAQGWRGSAEKRGGTESVSPRVRHTESPGSRQCPPSLAAARRRRRPPSVSSRASAATEHALRRRSTRAKPVHTAHDPRVDSTENSNFGYVAPAPGKIRGSFAPAIFSVRRPDLVVDERI